MCAQAPDAVIAPAFHSRRSPEVENSTWFGSSIACSRAPYPRSRRPNRPAQNGPCRDRNAAAS